VYGVIIALARLQLWQQRNRLILDVSKIFSLIQGIYKGFGVKPDSFSTETERSFFGANTAGT
jgi:hypothetical protein